jgi:hypothetical protein
MAPFFAHLGRALPFFALKVFSFRFFASPCFGVSSSSSSSSSDPAVEVEACNATAAAPNLQNWNQNEATSSKSARKDARAARWLTSLRLLPLLRTNISSSSSSSFFARLRRALGVDASDGEGLLDDTEIALARGWGRGRGGITVQ